MSVAGDWHVTESAMALYWSPWSVIVDGAVHNSVLMVVVLV